MVTIKRASGAVAERVAAAAPAEPEGPSRPTEDELRAIGAEQLAHYRAEFVTAAQRFGKGAALWAERGWTWEEPNWELPPEQWPPLARLLWLFERCLCAASRAQFLNHLATLPGWCADCHPGEEMPKGFSQEVCLEHGKVAVIGSLARAVFGVVTWEGE